MFFSTAQHVTINAIGSGDLDIVPAPPPAQGLLGSSSADVTINAPITGPGGIQPSNGGNIRLNGVNTYSGGTNLASTSTLIHFSNGSSFGSGPINMGIAGLAPLLASGGAEIVLPNDFTSSVNNAGINFAADAATPVTSTGTWSLGANNLVLRNNGDSASPLTLTNTISGTANVTLSANNGGTIIFSGPNSYYGYDLNHRPGRNGRWFVCGPAQTGRLGHDRRQLQRRSCGRRIGSGWDQPEHEQHHAWPEHVDRRLGD